MDDVIGKFLLMIGLFLLIFVGSLALLTVILDDKKQMDKNPVLTSESTELGDLGEVDNREERR